MKKPMISILLSFVYSLNLSALNLSDIQISKEQVETNRLAIQKKYRNLPSEKTQKLALYMSFLKLNAGDKQFNDQLLRLSNSSMQFLWCEDSNDWVCLEKYNEVTPRAPMRQEIAKDLGQPVLAGDKLEYEYFFTEGWFKNREVLQKKDYIIPEKTVAHQLSDKIKFYGKKNIWMALYGLDDIQNTMAPVYNALALKVKEKVPTYAVIDIFDAAKPDSFVRDYDIVKISEFQYSIQKKIDLNYSYIFSNETLNSAFKAPSWAKDYLETIAKLKEKMKSTELKKFILNEMFLDPREKIKIEETLKDKYESQKLVLTQKLYHEFSEKIKNIEQQNGISKDEIQSLKSSAEVQFNIDLAEALSQLTTDLEKEKTAQFISLLKPYDNEIADLAWIAFNKSIEDVEHNFSRATFQYNSSMDLIKLLNQNIKENQLSRARIEFPFKGIMHNKFLVFEDQENQKSVWTGTTNVSQTCMGDESNSNLSLFIRNDKIANTFLVEFNEMHSTQQEGKTKPESLLTGSFHEKKRPNTQRYFYFKDGTEVKVHFSPTDDGEHRALIPLIHSGRKGDKLRISMFGAGGYEYVRAMQLAAARGVQIEILFDRVTGASMTSWWKSEQASVMDQNPYISEIGADHQGYIKVRNSAWNGLNHHKTATLSRYDAKTNSYRGEVIVVGSQNWSQTGNDLNDENMLTIRNKKAELDVIKAFNLEFDQRLWTTSVEIDRNAKISSSVDID